MAMYSFVPPFREAKFCSVPSCVFDKLGRTAGKKSLRNSGLCQDMNVISWKYTAYRPVRETQTLLQNMW
jgi:hypothetical protein